MIFSRGKGTRDKDAARHAKADERPGARRRSEPVDDIDEVEEKSQTGSQVGPYDAADAPEGISHLDLGALRLAAVDGVEVRVQADPDGRIQQVLLVHGDSALQLGAFAAPRSEGIWEEVRGEIRKQLFTDGVAVEEADGEYGVELRARVRTPEGLTDIRFVGVDGPRWLVRAVYQGPAAVDPSIAPALVECLHKLVVDRGHEAMPVREALPLRLPREIAEHGQDRDDEDGSASAGADGAATDQSRRPAPTRRRPSPRPRRRP